MVIILRIMWIFALAGINLTGIEQLPSALIVRKGSYTTKIYHAALILLSGRLPVLL